MRQTSLTEMMKNNKEAFHWIISILRKNKVDFHVTGGLAAKVYGSPRPLADIDIELHDEDLKKILPSVKPYIVQGPAKYHDDQFDIYGMSLRYKNFGIDLFGSDTQKIFDKKQKRWTREKIDFYRANKKKIFGKIVPVIPLNELLRYKEKIARAVDLEDIKNLREYM
ncbi:MAG: hypothetical protein Q7R83_04215 [bacterium]|nr:hypothetical protein [bacterium]